MSQHLAVRSWAGRRAETAGPLNQTAIVARLGLTKSSVSRTVEAGSRSGWIDVRPDPRSGRDRIATLTLQGADLVHRGGALLERSVLAVLPTESAERTATAAAVLCQFVGSVIQFRGPSL